LPISHAGMCVNCEAHLPSFKALRSWAVFEGPIRHAIHSLKYHQNMVLGDIFAQYLAQFVKGFGWQVDMVVAVPLGKQRMRERGYNQVDLVAKPFSGLQHWPYNPKALERVRETRSQVGLSPIERKENISGAFQADCTLVSGKVVLVLDDVATTGATLGACSDALVIAGAKTVYALTLVKALPQHGLLIV
jgi:ComF family protein